MSTAATPAPELPKSSTTSISLGLVVVMIVWGAGAALAGYQLGGHDNFRLRSELAKTLDQRDHLQKEKEALNAELLLAGESVTRCTVQFSALSEHTHELEQWQHQARTLMLRAAPIMKVCAQYLPDSPSDHQITRSPDHGDLGKVQ